MGPITKVYNDALKCAEIHHSSNRIRCLKKKFQEDIGGDWDKLLWYKIECTRLSDLNEISLAISAISLFTASLSLLANRVDVNELIRIAFWVLIVVLFITVIVLKNSGKYKKILMVLEAIEKEMDCEKIVEKKES